MASHVQVILTQDIDNLGKAGQLVKVKPGYARNFLIPRSLAMTASRASIQRLEHERKAALARSAKLKQTAAEQADKLKDVTVEVAKPAGEGDRLYGSVTTRDVATALAKQGYEIDRRDLQLPEAVKQLGEYEVTVKLAPEVTATFKLVVVRQ
jgi:large subunit ribosomal protein L9